MMGRLSIVILDEATSALNSGNEASLYERLRDSGATLISIAHRPAVLRHHTHALQLMGEGAWAVHEESAYQFEGAADTSRSGGASSQSAQALRVAAAG